VANAEWIRSERVPARLDLNALDRESPVPLWFQIAERLRTAIETEQLTPGDRLDNEIDLSERFGVSRPTVRQAIQALVQKGLVVRQRGVGTIVANRRINRPVALTSLYDDLWAAERQPTTKVLDIEERIADFDTAEKLGIDAGDPVLWLERLRFAEGRPLALMHNTIPLEVLVEPLTREALESDGLYRLLRAQGVRFHTANQIVGARTATKLEASLLECPRSATMLVMFRTAWDPTGRTIEFGSHSYLASRYSFQISLSLK
jgi:DNA-binding GntR family transcriptional regulator